MAGLVPAIHVIRRRMTQRGAAISKIFAPEAFATICGDAATRLWGGRRGWPGQARPWRQRPRGESEAANQPSTP